MWSLGTERRNSWALSCALLLAGSPALAASQGTPAPEAIADASP